MVEKFKNIDWRTPTVVSLLCLTAAVISLRLIETPLGPGRVVYSLYAPFWVFVGLALVSSLLAIRWLSVPWWTVTTVGVLVAVTLVALSVVWNVPYGPHDTWTHLWRIHAEDLDPASNVYPSLHAGMLVAMAVLGLPAEPLLTRLVALSAGAGVLFLVVAARRFPAGRTARQTAVLVAVPAVTLGFIPRPYTVAIPFVLLFYWFLFVLVGSRSSLSRASQGVLAVMFASLVFLHPLVTVLIVAIGGTGYFVVRWVPRVSSPVSISAGFTTNTPATAGGGGGETDGTPETSQQSSSVGRDRAPSSISISPVLVLLLALPLAAHFLFIATVGERIIGAVVVSLITDVQTSSGGSGGVGIIGEAFSNLDNLLEFLARSSYALVLGIAALVALADDLVRRRVRVELAITLLAGASIFVFLVGANFVASTGVGLYRLFSLAPIVAFPAAIGAFRRRETTWGQTGTVVLAIAVVTAGLLVAFPSPLLGAAAQSGNEQQVEGVRWLASHNPDSIVGTWMTFWVMRGLYDMETTRRLSPTEAGGTFVTSTRQANYSWGTTDQPPSALYVVDAAARQDARHLAVEKDPTALRCLQTFQRAQSRVYQNGDTSAYLLSTPRKPQCAPI